MSVVVTQHDVLTACGAGVDACWQGVLAGQPRFSAVERFSTKAFTAHHAAQVPGLEAEAAESLAMQMVRPLLQPLAGRLPADTLVLLATTTGEVDLLERSVLRADGATEAGRLDVFLGRVLALLGAADGRLISAACASASAAVAEGAALIEAGQRDAVLVVACDALTEFVFSGFSTLMALDPDGARPFDRARKGLTLGEAAGYVLLMSGERARREHLTVLGEVAGWGLTSDANHMTGSSRDGDGLARAITQALRQAALPAQAIGSIVAHGTGTVYNDAMEMQAFRRVLGEAPVPTYSLKGCLGHTLGAAGLLNMVMALTSLQRKVVPPSAHLQEADAAAAGWVTPVAVPVPGLGVVLSTNAGFGGINSALVLRA